MVAGLTRTVAIMTESGEAIIVTRPTWQVRVSAANLRCRRRFEVNQPPQHGELYRRPKPNKPNTVSTITGVAAVIDGNTLEIHGQRIRFQGIDAPESSQLCATNNKPYRCAQQAALAMSDKIVWQTITCDPETVDKYGRTAAVCSLGGVDLNRWMVTQGHALAYRTYSRRYVAHEESAKAAKLGIWKSEFVQPWDWRTTHKH